MACPVSYSPRLVGDPVDTLTGAVVDRMLDFRLTGPIELRWMRHYDSGQSHRSFSLGRGCAHHFDRSLSFDADGLLYEEPVGRAFRFPFLASEGDECALHGLTLRRVSSETYLVFRHAEPAMEFVFPKHAGRARLTRLLRGSFEVRFWYDAAQRLVRIDYSAERHIDANEDEAGRLIRLAVGPISAKPGYLLVAYHYDDNCNLIATQNNEGHGYAFAYDEANRMVFRRGRKGFQFYFKYDAQGRCIRAMGDDRLYGVALDYNIPGRLTKVTRPDRGVWTYKFTPRGELQEVVDPLGGIQKLVHDSSGRLLLDVDPNGNATRLVYDKAGEPVAKIDPLGHRISLPEDPNAPDPLAHRVAANAAEYEYGRLLDVTKITLPNQAELQKLPLSNEARSLVSVRPEREPSLDRATPFEVPPLRVLWWPEPKRGRIFNDLGKLLEQRDEFGRLRQWTYDESGNVTEHIDFDGGRWVYDYGAWHFLKGLTDPLGNEVRFTYTPYGEVASFTDAGGTRSEYSYDKKDHLVAVRRHGVVKETYTRDASGNLIAKHGADGRELLRFEIGRGNLPVRRILASGDEHTFEYDKSGRHLVVATRKDRVHFAYDLLGNRTLDERNGVGVEHRYQGWWRLAESVIFDRFVVSYVWRNGTLTITDPGGHSHEVRFLRNGLVERRFSNGSRETAQYDMLGRCLFKHAERKVGQIWSRRYHWSGEGELRRVEDNVRGEVRHEYDAAHRLRRRTINGRIETYEMDLADNILAQPGLGNVELQEGNRLKRANGASFFYNDRNHIEARKVPDGTTQYVYDSRDQLVRVESPRGVFEAHYDALGRRTRKTWNGLTTEYYWNTDQLVAELGADGPLRLYIYADHLALSPFLCLEYESIDAAPDSCSRYVLFTDQIGTPCLAEDDQGRGVWRADVAPFGAVDLSSRNSIKLNLRFPGHLCDPELALHYNRFRYYDPQIGRYIQTDPWGIAGENNLYAYWSNPLLKADVRGLGEDPPDSSKPKDDDSEKTEKPRPSTGEEQPASSLMSKEDAETLARQKNAEYRAELDGKIEKREMSQKDAGPVVATVVDRRTGETFSAHNDRNGNPPENMHPIIEKRVAEAQANPQHPSDPGAHAEVHALNDALNAREAERQKQGLPPSSESDLDEFTQVSEWRKGSGNSKMKPGEDAPRCGNCQTCTNGVDNRSGDAPPWPPPYD